MKKIHLNMKNSSIYVLTSIFEGFPNSMVEGLACGLPVIAADCKSGPREILCEEPNIKYVAKDIESVSYGIIVPPLDKRENWNYNYFDESDKTLAKAMLNLMGDDDLREILSKKARYRAKEFNFDLCKDKYKEIIK